VLRRAKSSKLVPWKTVDIEAPERREVEKELQGSSFNTRHLA
jgi:hypothetical protein